MTTIYQIKETTIYNKIEMKKFNEYNKTIGSFKTYKEAKKAETPVLFQERAERENPNRNYNKYYQIIETNI